MLGGPKSEVKLPPEVEEQLARLAELEKQNAELLADKNEASARLLDLGVRVADAGEIPIQKEDGSIVYKYMIDLPPSGGVSVGINGEQFYHGQSYEFDLNRLRTVREMVYRSWEHERSIKGSDENAYRPQLNAKLSGRRMGR
jgi:hypothetical protein